MTKYLIAFLILLSVATFAIAEDKHPCEEYKCYAAFNWGFNDAFGFGSSSGTIAPPAGSFLVLENGDNLLLESGDSFLTE